MNTKKQLTIAWSICAVLAIALIAALVVIMDQKKDLSTVLEEGSSTITEQRDRIAAVCEGTDTESQNRCQDELNRMANILREFSRDLQRATPENTPAAPAAE